jgi:GAF domain-containing protein
MSAYGGKADHLLPWRESSDLLRIEHRREPAVGGDMQRRGESEQPVKGRRHGAIRPKARKAPTARVSTIDLEHQLKEAREQQTATEEILASLAGSITDAKPVFDAITRNLRRLFDTRLVVVQVLKDGMIHLAAAGSESEFKRLSRYFPQALDSNTGGGRTMLSKQVLQFVPVLDNSAAPPATQQFARELDFNSVIFAPMIRGDKVIGALSAARREPTPFSDKEVALIKAFANQAVIAIENTRLLNELHESLQQQTATADVLKVISRSTFDLQTVLDTLVQSATRLCDADMASVTRPRDADGAYYHVAYCGFSPEWFELMQTNPLRPARETLIGRTLLEGRVVHIPDVLADRDYNAPKAQQLGEFRAALGVPMLREGTTLGVFMIARRTPRPFTNKQIELATTFADQAVIAIENVRLFDEVQSRTRELSESLEQQTATSEVLKVISSSPGELQSAFMVMLENAVRICEAKFGGMFLREGDAFRNVALHNAPPAYAELRRRDPIIHPHPKSGLGRVVATKQVVHIADILEDEGYLAGASISVAIFKTAGARTLLVVPMLKDNEVVGNILIYRQQVRPFTDKQIELVKNFAAQAVIAIENTRLLNELRESLQQQTATSDVLKVISSSLNDLKPVFETIGQRAGKLCDAEISVISMVDGDRIRLVSINGVTEEGVEAVRRVYPMRLDDETVTARTIRSAAICHIADVLADTLYQTKDAARVSGFRGSLGVPMIRDEQVIGAIFVARRQPGLFTDAQVQLLKTFADQAVIAIENVRLFNETKEALAQQTATADVLKVISSSRGELDPVFNAMLENAVRICSAKFGNLMLLEGDAFRTVALHGAPPAYAEARRREPLTRHRPGTVLGQVLATKRPAQIADVQAEPAYYEDPSRVNFLKLAGARTVVAVPMLREDELVGAIFIYRQEVQPFTEKQIELLENFAAQAVIAIENTRLLNELRESLQQQTATADVLKLISRSTFDLRTVLQTLIESAARFCDADKANVIRERNAGFYSAEAYGYSREFIDYVRDIPIKAERGTASGRALLEGRVVHIADVKADPEYTLVEGQRLGDYRTILCVPMLREGIPIGVLVLTRSEVRPFTDKQIELVTTFADQAAIAIENVRLFENVEARTRELAKSLEDLRTTQDRLVQTQKLASLGQLTAGIAHEIKNPLNFVNNFSGISAELIDELQDTLKGPIDDKARAEINELTNILRGNLDKVVQHGKRADAIVKNMLLHSREGSGEHRSVDINALIEESLNLAYHGARAEKQGFNITLERSFDPAAEQADVFPQDITRVLLNLILNGFYAATKRKAEAGDGYEPTLMASTRSLGDRVEIRIRDNGTGIPPGVKEKIFNPFFTTKPAGEGTGLGLSISHDIIVKQHGGSIEVETEPGEYTEFRIILPRAAAFVTASGAQS